MCSSHCPAFSAVNVDRALLDVDDELRARSAMLRPVTLLADG
jgi:hypothetical protein